MDDLQSSETVYHLAKEYRQKLQVKDGTEHNTAYSFPTRMPLKQWKKSFFKSQTYKNKKNKREGVIPMQFASRKANWWMVNDSANPSKINVGILPVVPLLHGGVCPWSDPNTPLFKGPASVNWLSLGIDWEAVTFEALFSWFFRLLFTRARTFSFIQIKYRKLNLS